MRGRRKRGGREVQDKGKENAKTERRAMRMKNVSRKKWMSKRKRRRKKDE